jgi:DNA-binding Lrp family transcriptional regulator
LDEFDKAVLHEICTGIHSYDDLAKSLKVTRGTIYRRIEKLESLHVISRKIMAIPNFKNLKLSAILVGLNVEYDDMEDVVEALKNTLYVKFIWRAYGSHQLVFVLVCQVGCEGRTIADLQKTLSKLRTGSYDVSIGFEWEKVDISPF